MWIKVIICCWDERIGNDASYKLDETIEKPISIKHLVFNLASCP
jgi:hypothetical protein